jgi:hypothetical protein
MAAYLENLPDLDLSGMGDDITEAEYQALRPLMDKLVIEHFGKDWADQVHHAEYLEVLANEHECN